MSSSTSLGPALTPTPSQTVRSLPMLARLQEAVASFHGRRMMVVAVFAAMFGTYVARPTDIDFWWHLKTGEIIARSWSIPTTDPFSFTAAGRPWVAHEWLWELVVYHLYRLGGYVLPVLASALLVSLAYALLYRLLRQLGTNEYVSLAIVLWASFLALPSIGVRPREVTLLFLAFYVSRLVLYREGRVRHLWYLPPVMLVWANVHGPFILGLGVIAIYLLGDVAVWRWRGGEFPQHLLVVSMATLGASFINPDGPLRLLYPVGYYLQGENPSFAHVTEFQSPDFHQIVYLPFAVSILAMMVLGRVNGRTDVAEALMIVAFTLQALISVRHVAVYALVTAPVLAMRLRDHFPAARELSAVQSRLRVGVLNGLLLLCLMAVGTWYMARSGGLSYLQLSATPSTRGFPVEGARFIEDHGLPGPIFNHQPWGGYLVYRWYPERPVFIDGRVDMYGPAIVKDYLDVIELRPGWQQVLDKYGVRTLLIEKESALSNVLLLDERWQLVFRGDVEDVFVRR